MGNQRIELGADENADKYPSQKFTIFYQGQGKLRYHGSVRLNASLSQTGRDVVETLSFFGFIIIEA